MTTGKTIALTRQTFVGKVMSLLFRKAFWYLLLRQGVWRVGFGIMTEWVGKDVDFHLVVIP